MTLPATPPATRPVTRPAARPAALDIGALAREVRAAPVQVVAIRELRGGHSPRVDGVRADHARQLAGAGAELPPIVVHRPTMRVVDGAHRVRAAELRGATTVPAHFYDGPADLAFMLAVQANVTHGLPLSPADREAAAVRLLRSRPGWSNRALAAVVGLSDSTVGAIRRRIGSAGERSVRIGRDGRARPVDASEGRRAAVRVIELHPDASLRQIARAAGISTGTARDVKARLRRGEDPVPQRRGAPSATDSAHAVTVPESATTDGPDPAELFRSLCSDPSLRLTERGRTALRWLSARAVGPAGWEEHVDSLPAHSVYTVAELARACSRRWDELADRLDRRAATT